MSVKLAIGLKKVNGKLYGKYLDWNTNNGIIIAGKSGSGKSNTAAWYLTQLAAQGVKLIIADYNGSGGTGQSLIERTEHLSDAYLWQPVTTGTEIIRYIEAIHELGKLRLQGIEKNHFPIAFVIDEFSSFIANMPPPNITKTIKDGDTKTVIRAPTYMQRFIDSLVTLRKVNIHIVVMGQNWIQAGTVSGVRVFRSNFSDIILHHLSSQDTKLFVDDREIARTVETLRTGYIQYQNHKLYVPLLNENDIEWSRTKITQTHIPITSFTPEEIKVKVYSNEAIKHKQNINKTWSNARLLCYYLGIPWNIKYRRIIKDFDVNIAS